MNVCVCVCVCGQKAQELSVEMKELCDEVGFVYYLIIARLYDIDPKLNKNERTTLRVLLSVCRLCCLSH